MPKSGWLERQIDKNVKDVKRWPAWMREGAIRLDPPESLKNKVRSSCTNKDEGTKTSSKSAQ